MDSLLIAAVVSLAFGLCAGLAVFFLLRALAAQAHGALSSRRAQAFVGPHAGHAPNTLEERVNRFLLRIGQADQFSQTLGRAEMGVSAGQFIINSFVLAAVLLLVGMLFFRDPLAALILGVGGLVAPAVWVSQRTDRTQRRFAEQLPEALTIMSNALIAGSSTIQALEQAALEIKPPLGPELRRVVEEVRVGRSLEEALMSLLRRAPGEELEAVIASFLIQRRTGGNLAELLFDTAALLREDLRLKSEARILTSQARFSAQVVGALPMAVLGFFFFFNPSYVAPLFTTTVGLVLLTAALVLELVGFFVIQRVAAIRV